MPTQFPQPNTTLVPLHWILGAIVLACILGLVLAFCRKPFRNDGLVWWVVVFLVSELFSGAVQPVEGAYPPAWQYLSGVWSLAAVACAVSVDRHLRLGQPNQATISFAALFGIGVIVICVIPLEETRESARFHQCRNQMKSLGLVMAQDKSQLQPGPTVVGNPPRSWRVELLPFLQDFERHGQDLSPRDLYEKYAKDEPWDADANLEIAQAAIHMYQCPAATPDRDSQQRKFTSYALVTGPQTIFENSTPRPLTDDLSSTALLVEACGLGIVWTQPRDVDVTREIFSLNQPGKTPTESPSIGSSFHRRGVNVLLADGSMTTLPLNTDPKVLKALMTSAEAGK